MNSGAGAPLTLEKIIDENFFSLRKLFLPSTGGFSLLPLVAIGTMSEKDFLPA
jgi:hypothetical protein